MTLTQLRSLVSRYIGERLDEWEEATYSMRGMEALRDAGEWQDCLSSFAQSTVEDCSTALRSNNIASISDTVKEFIERYDLKADIAEGSSSYRRLSRELMIAEQVIAGRAGYRKGKGSS